MRVSRTLFGGFLAAALSGFVLVSAQPASAAIYSRQQALPADIIQQFTSNPSSLLSQFPDGGPLMIAKVRDLAASDPATVEALIGLLKTANPDQASSIGTALGQVALMAVNSDQPFATDLQTKIAQAGNVSALAAFSAVVGGDIQLAAATGPGGGGAGGGGESQTGAYTGLSGFFAGSPLNLNVGSRNTPDSFTVPSFSGSTPGSGSVSAF